MRSLTTLDLSYNDLSGEVPAGSQFLVFKNASFGGGLRQARAVARASAVAARRRRWCWL